jgi:ribonuclease D
LLYLDDERSAAEALSDLGSVGWLAVDLEAAGFHRYSDQVCLVQLTTPDETYVLDPLAFDPSDLLRGPLEDPEVLVLMHGGDYDMRMLDRDLGIRPRNIFDTQIAASLLAEEGLGLGALLEKYLDVKLSKKFQRADWAQRPLTDGMLEYAADDTRYLPQLVNILADKLEAAGRMTWAEEEFRRMEDIRWTEEPDGDPVARVKKAKHFAPRDTERLRVALAWRDEIARSRDRATFRVVGDPPLMEVAETRPRSVGDLIGIKGFPERLAKANGKDLLARLREVDDLPEDQLTPFPRLQTGKGWGRATPEEEERTNRLKAVRNEVADEVGLPRGTVLSNGMIEAIARSQPKDAEALRAMDGMRAWQYDLVAERLLKALKR